MNVEMTSDEILQQVAEINPMVLELAKQRVVTMKLAEENQSLRALVDDQGDSA